MRVFIGGARGSRPCTGAEFAEFGGDTTSILVVGAAGDVVVLDAGSGLAKVGVELARLKPSRVDMLFSHYHLDHVIGLAMMPLFYEPRWTFHFHGFRDGEWGVGRVVETCLNPPFWPVPRREMAAGMEFHDISAPGMPLVLGGLRITAWPVPHPNPCFAYRVEDSGTGVAMVFATDVECAGWGSGRQADFADFCRQPRPPGLLLVDAHVPPGQDDFYRGWGHSSWREAVSVARSAGAGRLLCIHHDPEADDCELRKREAGLVEVMPNAALARAGEWWCVEQSGKVATC